MNDSLKKRVSRQTLLRLAGHTYFKRGEAYFAEDRVRDLVEDDGLLMASVQGTSRYRVKLWVEDTDIAYSCSCPLGVDGAFCKHCVAAGLAWLEETTEVPQKNREAKKHKLTMNDVRTYLSGRDKKALVDLLLEQANKDTHFRNRLLLRVARDGQESLDLEPFRVAIAEATRIRGYVDYDSAHDYAEGIHAIVESMEELLDDGHGAEIVDLSEYALACVEDTLESIDDSNGEMGEILERLQDLHYSACKQAKPDPEKLAKRLFEWEFKGEWEIFTGAARAYADILGEAGLAVYRSLAEAEWAKVPTLTSSNRNLGEFGWRFRITHIMEDLAELSQDVEALVAVKSRNLSQAYAYLRIAEIYKEAGKQDKALEWAEQGIKIFSKNTDEMLIKFLADEYHRRARHSDAMALIWAGFSDRPSLESYQALKKHAHKAGDWPAWREKALALLREDIEKDKQRAKSGPWGRSNPADLSELVRIFLWEKDVEAAWREAKKGGCSENLWMELAAKREKNHPEDAMEVYVKEIEPLVNLKNNEAYTRAINLLRKVRRTLVLLGRVDEFASLVQSVRGKHKPKRNFIKQLDSAKWQ